jgi:hypothetical protein
MTVTRPVTTAALVAYLAARAAGDAAAPICGNTDSRRCYVPTWNPTYSMWRSTILMPCNNSGVSTEGAEQAAKYGVAMIDWSNAKAQWANAKPMTAQELLTQQAEMILAKDPGIPGEQPRVWVYRNQIKALNFFSTVREKLDDPTYAGWFVHFKDYQGPSSNHSYGDMAPACTFNKCSGLWHDQYLTPHSYSTPLPHGGGSGLCKAECDCGDSPCGMFPRD